MLHFFWGEEELGRAAAPKENGGGVGLYATSPRCGRASLAVGFSLQSLTLAYACMPVLVAYTMQYAIPKCISITYITAHTTILPVP